MQGKKLLVLIIVFLPLTLLAQSKTNLGRPVTNALCNEQNPSLTADGKLLLFVTDYGEEKLYAVTAKRVGNNWTKPEDVPAVFKSLTNDGGFSFTPDGNAIFFHSTRYGGVGNYDIWLTNRKDEKAFHPAANLAMPVNSKDAEMDPYLTIDNKRLYFVRASGKKTLSGADCGTIFYSDKTTSSWTNPIALPSPVNSGCECAPRLLSDNRTLIFASERPGGKGGLDLYKSVLTDGKWSSPRALEFLNTESDDRYVAIPADADEIFFNDIVNGKNDLFRMKLPEEFKPLKTAYVKGTVKGGDTKKPLTVKVFVNKVADGTELDKIYNNAADGKFELVLTDKDKLDIYIVPFTKGYAYYSKRIDLASEEKSILLEEEIILPALKKGSVLDLPYISIDSKVKLSKDSKQEVEKLANLLKENPSVAVEIAAYMEKVDTDSVKRDDLTEVITDTLIRIEIKRDSIEKVVQTTVLKDSVEQVIDSISYVQIVDTIRHTIVKYTYHNDRTQKEAEEIKKQLFMQGIGENRIVAIGYGDKKKKGKRRFEAIVR